MRFLLAIPALAIALTNVACAHAVRIDSNPGAEIFVNGQSVGPAPATYHETSGFSDSVRITAKLRGAEKTVEMQRKDVDFSAVGAGAAAGAAGCMAASAATLVSAFVFTPCVLVTGPVAWGSLMAGPLAGWIWFGNRLPDHIEVRLEDASPAVAMTDEQRPGSQGF